MTEALKLLLADIRQHPGYPDLLRAVEMPKQIRYRPGKGMTFDTFGADQIYTQGGQDQHQRWLDFLRGTSSQPKDEG